MSLTVTAEIHGLAGRAPELQELLIEHATALSGAPGCTGAGVLAPAAGDVGEYVLTTRWTDEAALSGHYKTPEYTYYIERIGALIALPSDVRVEYVEREVRATADLSLDPTRQD
jgi:quinol monooxygenase YgiN